MKVLSRFNYIVRQTGSHRTQCDHPMRLCKFIPHENLPDNQMAESQFCNDPDVINEPKLFATEKTHSTKTHVAVSSDTEESSHENQQKSFLNLQPETPPPTYIDEVVHTTPPPSESHHEPLVTLPDENFERPQPELQPIPAEGENQETPTPWSHSTGSEPSFVRRSNRNTSASDWPSDTPWTNH